MVGLTAGALAGMAEATTMWPAEWVKTNLQLGKHTSIFQCVRSAVMVRTTPTFLASHSFTLHG